MRHVTRQTLWALAVALVSLVGAACDDLVVQGGLPIATDDRVVGNWADEKGEVAWIVRRGKGMAFERWTSADDFRQAKAPTVFYLAKVGGVVYAQEETKCDAHAFKAVTPQGGCWSVVRLNLGQNLIDRAVPDVDRIVSDSRAGLLRGIQHAYGTSVGKEGTTTTCVTLSGSTEENVRAMAAYGNSESIWKSWTRYRRL